MALSQILQNKFDILPDALACTEASLSTIEFGEYGQLIQLAGNPFLESVYIDPNQVIRTLELDTCQNGNCNPTNLYASIRVPSGLKPEDEQFVLNDLAVAASVLARKDLSVAHLPCLERLNDLAEEGLLIFKV